MGLKKCKIEGLKGLKKRNELKQLKTHKYNHIFLVFSINVKNFKKI